MDVYQYLKAHFWFNIRSDVKVHGNVEMKLPLKQ